MATQREQIILAALAKLQALNSVAAARVFRSRETAVTRGETPCIVIRKDQEDPPENRNVAERQLQFVVEIDTRGDDGEAVADPIEDEVHAALMSDQTLGGACLLLWPDATQWEGANADQAAHRTSMHFSATYRTTDENLSAPA